MKRRKKLQIKKLTHDATVPTSAYTNSAGIDLYSSKYVEIYGHSIGKIPTGIAINFPPGIFGKIEERSSVGGNLSLSKKAGIIDNDYQGEIIIIMNNDSEGPLKIEKGTKIAQLVLQEEIPVNIELVSEFTTTTERGTKGFGSSDNK